jgi:hypothetical protein
MGEGLRAARGARSRGKGAPHAEESRKSPDWIILNERRLAEGQLGALRDALLDALFLPRARSPPRAEAPIILRCYVAPARATNQPTRWMCASSAAARRVSLPRASLLPRPTGHARTHVLCDPLSLSRCSLPRRPRAGACLSPSRCVEREELPAAVFDPVFLPTLLPSVLAHTAFYPTAPSLNFILSGQQLQSRHPRTVSRARQPARQRVAGRVQWQRRAAPPAPSRAPPSRAVARETFWIICTN